MEYSVFLVLAPIAASILLLALSTAYRYRDTIAGKSLIAYLALVTALLSGNTAELIARTEAATLFWAKLDHVYLSLIPVAWVSFAFRYSGLERYVRGRRFWLAWIFPIATNAIVQTNDLHHLFWSEIEFFHVRGFLTMGGSYGPWFWVNGAHLYALLILGAVVIIRSYVNSRDLYSRQSLWVACGALIPIVFNAIYAFRLLPFIRKDFSPVTFALAGFAFFIGMYRFRLLRVVPVARNLIVDDLETGVVVLDSSTKILDFNRVAAMLFHLPDEAVGTPVSRWEALDELVGDSTLDIDARYRVDMQQSDGVRHTEVQIRPFGRRRDQSSGTILTVTDVTEWVQLIEANKISLQRLEEKTRSLQEMQERLVERERLAAIGKLAASIAHDINNPLSYLKSNVSALMAYADRFVELLENGAQPSGEGQQEKKRIIDDLRTIRADTKDGLERIIDVTKNLLSNARSDPARAMVKFDLNDGIRRALSLAKNEYRHVARVELDLQPIPSVECLPGEINQVLLNIITNAAQAVRESVEPSDMGKIAISTRAYLDRVVCDISDDGPPIPTDLLERIFDPFYTTKSGREGTGLGLSIAWEIVVSRHHGTIEVETGDVTTFRVSLPISQPS